MTLNEFIQEEKQKIEAFRTYWEEYQKTNPRSFPEVMTPGDWDDQFREFEYEEE